MSGADAIAVVVVTYNSASKLAALAGSLAPQLRDDDQLVIVDNASADGTVALARSLPGPGALVIEAGANRGFAAACRLGVDATRTPLIALINPDTLFGEGALERLRAVARERPDWSAWQPAVMLPDGRINTAGGVVHYLGMGWAGRCGHDARELPALPYEAAFPSGAALVVRRCAWLELGGMRDDYFLYGEDLDLGLRLWLAGHRAGVEPRARVIHDYEFDKGANKWFLLERNRWRTVLATYPAPLLAALAPVLLFAELGILAVAARDGWLVAKLRAQAATLSGLPAAMRRRRVVQRGRRISAAQFAEQLSGAFDSPNIVVPAATARASRAYWRLVRWSLRYDRASVARPCR